MSQHKDAAIASTKLGMSLLVHATLFFQSPVPYLLLTQVQSVIDLFDKQQKHCDFAFNRIALPL